MSDGPYSLGSGHWPGLSKLIEECGEVVQVCGKILGTGGAVEHWDGSNLKERLEEEIADVMAASAFVVSFCGLDKDRVHGRMQNKLAQFMKWHRDQIEATEGRVR